MSDALIPFGGITDPSTPAQEFAPGVAFAGATYIHRMGEPTRIRLRLANLSTGALEEAIFDSTDAGWYCKERDLCIPNEVMQQTMRRALGY